MGEGQGQERTQLTGNPDQDAAQLRAEIEDVRGDLGDTVEALAAKTDVKTRAQEKADELKRKLPGGSGSGSGGGGNGSPAAGASSALQQVRVKAKENPVPTAALGALIGGFVIGRLTRR
jgi:hypothetical protein